MNLVNVLSAPDHVTVVSKPIFIYLFIISMTIKYEFNKNFECVFGYQYNPNQIENILILSDHCRNMVINVRFTWWRKMYPECLVCLLV